MATLNRAGRTYASSLISSGSVDKTSAWSFTAEDGNALLGHAGNDWANYGKSHLGVDATEDFNTKAHWKYPVAKGGKLYRAGLIAARQRAGQQRDTAVEAAAGALLDEIDGNSDRTHESHETRAPQADAIRITGKRPPSIELDLRAGHDMCEPGLTDESLSRWQAGLKSAVPNAPATIEMFGVIGEDFWSAGITATSVSSQLKALGTQDVDVMINSPGGDMFEGIAIYNLLQQYKGKVTVKILGIAASAASVIAMAGDEVLIGQGAFFMIHNCWVMAMGNRHDFLDVAGYLAPFDDAMAGIYATKTGMEVSECADFMDNETYFNATQCVEDGFATGILPANTFTEDTAATQRAKALEPVRRADRAMAKGGMTRSQRRAFWAERNAAGTQNAADGRITQNADADGTQNAADEGLLTAALAMFTLK